MHQRVELRIKHRNSFKPQTLTHRFALLVKTRQIGGVGQRGRGQCKHGLLGRSERAVHNG